MDAPAAAGPPPHVPRPRSKDRESARRTLCSFPSSAGRHKPRWCASLSLAGARVTRVPNVRLRSCRSPRSENEPDPFEVSTSQIYMGAIPFVCIQIVMVGLVLSFPELVGHDRTVIEQRQMDIQLAPPKPSDAPAPVQFR